MLTFVPYLAISIASDTNMFQGQDPHAAKSTKAMYQKLQLPRKRFYSEAEIRNAENGKYASEESDLMWFMFSNNLYLSCVCF
jgi:hypothetical protein